MKTKSLDIKNVSAGPRGYDNTVALSCVWNGARYHVWLKLEGEIPGETVYKNPVEEGRKEKTLRLSANTGPMRALIAAMLEVYHRDGLLDQFKKREADEEAKRIAKAHAEYALNVKREAGPELYQALKELVEAIWDGRAEAEGFEKFTDPARLILEKVDKKVKE